MEEVPFEDEDRAILAGKIIGKMLRKRVLGGHKKQITTIAKWFPSDREGAVKTLIDEMLADPKCPIEGYGGGHRSNVRLTSYEAAEGFAEKLDYETEWL